MAAQVVSGAPVASHAASASAPALHRQASGTAVPSVGAPASVHQALHSPGEPLDMRHPLLSGAALLAAT